MQGIPVSDDQPQRYGATATGVPVPDDNAPKDPLYSDKPELENKFVIQGYKDPWAAALFLVLNGVLLWIAAHTISNPMPPLRLRTSYDSSSISSSSTSHVLPIIVVSGIAIVAASMFLFHSFTSYPNEIIVASTIVAVVLGVIQGVQLLVNDALLIGFIVLLGSAFSGYVFYSWRDRIPFAGLLLRISSMIVSRHWALSLISYASVAFSLAHVAISLAAVAPASIRTFNAAYRAQQLSNVTQRYVEPRIDPTDTAVMLFVVFMMYWTMNVAANVVHMTASGVTATYYFVGGFDNMPRNPTLASGRRAMTTSFGSVCYGSLLVSILQLIEQMAKAARRRDHDHEERAARILACLLECLGSLVRQLVQYFNRYAFVYCAMYGYDYLEAGRKTWLLAQRTAYTAILNDSLVDNVIGVSLFCSGCFVGLITGILFGMVPGVISGLVGMALLAQILKLVDSTLVTLFVCFAEEPQLLAEVNGELYAAVSHADGSEMQV